MSADAKELLDEVLLVLAHLATGVNGRCAVEEGRVEVVVGAGGIGEEIGGFIDAGRGDSCRSGERLDVRVLRKQDGALHEFGPDGRCGIGTLEWTC